MAENEHEHTYEARESSGADDHWEVVNIETGIIVSEHEPPDAQEQAEEMAELLEEVNAEMEKEAEDE